MGTVTALVPPENDADLLREYSADDLVAELSKLKDECAALDPAAGPEAYEASRVAVGKLRTSRTAIEKRRTSLKSEHLERGRRIDAAAKFLTAKIEEIETPLLAKKRAVDEAEARAKYGRENAERIAKEAKERQEAEEAAAKQRAEQAAEAARLKVIKDEQDREADRLLQEQAKLDRARREEEKRQAAERKKLEDERKEFEAERSRVRAEEEAKEAAARFEVEAAERAVRDRAAAAAAEEAKAAAAAAERVRLEALKPDVAKLKDFAAAIMALAGQEIEFQTNEAFAAHDDAVCALMDSATTIEDFTKGIEPEGR